MTGRDRAMTSGSHETVGEQGRPGPGADPEPEQLPGPSTRPGGTVSAAGGYRMAPQVDRSVGIDVAQQRLDVAVAATGATCTVDLSAGLVLPGVKGGRRIESG